ncbi:hypothetical protein CEXT_81681 [Caerostris extrusa]|uniref:Uncharacterized protein n=1 Tax=Caerostris extrusa TaxID=172846 RepID=A0AAV4SD47_CAEEX|nr:hypothetical protein CEXT_81681 [Caerostris extrusa]
MTFTLMEFGLTGFSVLSDGSGMTRLSWFWVFYRGFQFPRKFYKRMIINASTTSISTSVAGLSVGIAADIFHFRELLSELTGFMTVRSEL